ncbi:uncharacterized protein [Euphorbia lathyris]|uniref:uncharacterized protein n=1 Tax=Euphorbia lathyris TaxID=212925 RepID=UPI0033139746
MAGRSQIGAVEEDVEGLPEPELVISSKSAVQNAEEALVSREDKLKREIEAMEEDNESLQRMLQVAGLEKIVARKECEMVEKLVPLLRTQRDDLCGVLEMSLEQFIDLRKEICELECEKLRSKTAEDIYEWRIRVLKVREVCLEQELEVLLTGKKPGAVDMEVERSADMDSHDESDELISSAGNGKRVKIEEHKPSPVDDDSSSSSHAIKE